MTDSLAFVPVEDLPKAMDFLKDTCLPELEDLFDYFDTTYVSGSYKWINRAEKINLKKILPLEQCLQETCWSEPSFYMGVHRMCTKGYQRSLDHTGHYTECESPVERLRKATQDLQKKLKRTVCRIP